jgi:hypothetical protein
MLPLISHNLVCLKECRASDTSLIRTFKLEFKYYINIFAKNSDFLYIGGHYFFSVNFDAELKYSKDFVPNY